MTRQYRLPITVVLRPDGTPAGIIWRAVIYSVIEVLSRWHLRDRWWAQSPAASERPQGRSARTVAPLRDIQDARADPAMWEGWETPRSGTSASDRYYYRLRCTRDLLCDVYWDAATNAWILDRVWD